mgnify:CR=1 FL=1
MKKYILSLSIIFLIMGCGPTEEQKEQLSTLVADWKETSVEAVDLSEEIGDKVFLLESKKEANEAPETIEINLDGESVTCEPEYLELASTVNTFIQSWQEKSNELDELTDRMLIGSWNSNDQETLEALDLELKQREVQIEQWKKELEELNNKCSLTGEMLVIQEQES